MAASTSNVASIDIETGDVLVETSGDRRREGKERAMTREPELVSVADLAPSVLYTRSKSAIPA